VGKKESLERYLGDYDVEVCPVVAAARKLNTGCGHDRCTTIFLIRAAWALLMLESGGDMADSLSFLVSVVNTVGNAIIAGRLRFTPNAKRLPEQNADSSGMLH
jgi:hypothetical protein